MSDEPAKPAPRSRLFFHIRVTVLLCILGVVLLVAWGDVRSRNKRNDWSRTLDVALIVVWSGEAETDIGGAVAERAVALQDTLEQEMRHYRPDGPAPFAFEVFTTHRPGAQAPRPPDDDGLASAARFAWDLRGFSRAMDEAAALPDRRFDSRIYLIAAPPRQARRRSVEGIAQQGGRVGVVEVELDDSMVDFALFVATHELLHTLGASDLYDESGEPRVPEGLPEPDLSPRFPQRFAAIMARHRAIAPGRSVPPENLDELAVGASTARDIGWLLEP